MRLDSEPDAPATERPAWRAVVVPREHGGWGLTLEPVVLGLLLVPSMGGLALGVGALVAFVVRTPLELVLVDLRRRRWLARTGLAVRCAGAGLVLLAALVGLAVRWAGAAWWPFVVVAAPFVAVEIVHGMRSRSRRLAPELGGAVGIAAAAPVIVVAGGGDVSLALAAWLVLGARVVASIPFVRTQIVRLRRGTEDRLTADIAQLVGIAVAAVAVVVDGRALVGLAGVIVLAVWQTWWLRRPTVTARTLGLRQTGLGAALVVATALGAHLL